MMEEPDMLDALLADLAVPRDPALVAVADQLMGGAKETLAFLGVDTDDPAQMRAALAGLVVAVTSSHPAINQGMLCGLGLLVRELERRPVPESEADRDRRDYRPPPSHLY